MKTYHFTTSLALVLLLAGTVGSDEGKTKRVRCTFAEAFTNGVETNIDANGDDLSDNSAQGIDNCNIGRLFMQEESEYQAPLSAPVTCPAGSQEYCIQQNHGVATDEKTSDQLFWEIATDEATICLNPDLTFSFTGHGTFAGGTGQFTGASGFFDAQSTGKFLVFGFKKGVFGAFGQVSGTSTETLILPEG
jgi:hypothetical protein